MGVRKVWANIYLVVLLPVLVVGCAGGIPKIPNTPEAILEKADYFFDQERYFQSSELYKGFIARYPGHDRSDYAQFRLAESFYSDRQYELASVEFRIMISNYGYSQYVDDALFKTGVCYFEQAGGDGANSDKDPQDLYDAANQFNQFLQTFPNSELVPDAQEYLRRINTVLAKKSFKIAKFYFRHGYMRSSLIYCEKIIDNYPDNIFWYEAQYLKGCIYMHRGNYPEAIRAFSIVTAMEADESVKYEAESKLEEAQEFE